MYVYILSEKGSDYSLYTVGFYKPTGEWVPDSDHNDREKAAERVAFLNGQKNSEDDFQENVEVILRQHGLIV